MSEPVAQGPKRVREPREYEEPSEDERRTPKREQSPSYQKPEWMTRDPKPRRDMWEGRDDQSRRCQHLHMDGSQCGSFALKGDTHCRLHGANGKLSRRGRYRFKTKRLEDMYESFLHDPDRLDIRDEIALTRTVLAGIIEKHKGEIEHLSPAEAVTIVELSKDVANLCEQMARILKTTEEIVTLDHIKIVLDQVTTIMSKHTDWRTLEKVMEELDQIDIPVGGLQPALNGGINGGRQLPRPAEVEVEEQNLSEERVEDDAELD